MQLICGHDGIGRHARFRFSWSNPLGFESPCPHQITSCIFVLENAAFGISETKIIAKRGA